MNKPFIEFTVGEKTYTLKLSANAIVNIESKLGGDSLGLILSKSAVPSLMLMAMLFESSAKKDHQDITLAKVLDIFDEYFDEGNTVNDLAKDFFTPLIKSSGFFKKAATTGEN